MQRIGRMDEIRVVLAELHQAQTTAALCLSKLQELSATDLDTGAPIRAATPFADPTSFCIVWRNRSCHLGSTTSFKLFARLLRRANHYVSYDHLLRDVWSCNVKSDDTIRSAVRQLRRKLSSARMGPLARAIKGEGQHYGLFLTSS